MRRPAHSLRLHPTVERRIERAPIQLLGAMPADEITVEDIARVAGVSEDMVRLGYEDLDEVFVAIPERHLRRLCRRLQDRPGAEPVVDALISTLIEDDLTDEDEESIASWARVVLPAMPITATGRSIDDLTTSFQRATSTRTGLPPSDVHVLAWGAAIAGISATSFERWMTHGGNRSLLFAQGLEQLQRLTLT